MREGASTSLHRLRASPDERWLLEGELNASLQALADLGNDDDAPLDAKQWATLEQPARCTVHLVAGALVLDHPQSPHAITLTLTPTSEPQLGSRLQQLYIAGVVILDGREQRAKLTLEPTVGSVHQPADSRLRGTLRKTGEAHDVLRDWEGAILGQVPEPEGIDIEMTLKRLYLTPIVRCSFPHIASSHLPRSP